MNYRIITSALISLITVLFFSACSDNHDSSVSASIGSSNSSSKSPFEYLSSGTTIPEKQDHTSSSDQETISSSNTENFSTFSKFLAQFTASSEKSLKFDSHVMAYNTDLTTSCEQSMISYDENENIIPLKAISNENIAECFPTTFPLLNEKYSSLNSIKFFVVIMYMAESPLILTLNEFLNDKITFYVMYPGSNCLVNATGPIVMFLIADTENVINKENISITSKQIQSESWICDEKKNFPNDIEPYGEWFSDSLL